MKCKYYREDERTQYVTTCGREAVHEADIEGEYCQFCGNKIKFKEFTKIPEYLMEE